jgi:amino acid adenylation domain-containing protein
LAELPMLPDDEHHRVLVKWNATSADYAQEKCLHRLFMEQASRTPDAIAVVDEESELSYGELDRRSNQLAHHLRGLGVGVESVVGLCVERSIEMVVGLLGILKAGGTYLPLDPTYPAERLSYMLTDAGASVVVMQATVEAALGEAAVCRVRLDADREAIAGEADVAPSSAVRPDNLAYVIYTSGSTGRPKGVMVAHKALMNFLAGMARDLPVSRDDVVVAVTPVSFDIAGLEIFLPLSVGARTVVTSRDVAQSGEELRRKLTEVGATLLQATPASWRMLFEAGWEGGELKALCGGEALAPDLAASLARASSEAWNMYGPTETTIWSTASRLRGGGDVRIGRPILNTQVYVLDGHGQPAAIGVAGELHIGGAGLARGYRGRAGLTAERFVPSPFGEGERLYRTGDVARWRVDGELEYLGRIDHQVKLRGYRIELGEIEAQLVQHPQIGQAVVVADEDGNGEKRLVAYVVAGGSETALEPAELRSHLQRSLPDHMVPAAFVKLTALPLTPNGKIDRKALPKPGTDGLVRGAYVAPRTETEEVLAGIWSEVLGLERIGVYDNFFELGGHSLMATRVVVRIRDRLGFELPLRTMFETPTIAEIASRILPDGWEEEAVQI